MSERYGVDPLLVLALIEVESGFNETIISPTNDYGLMQINKNNHAWLSESLGITDFLDAEQNIEAGVFILAGLLEKYDNHRALMAYNMGEAGANRAVSRGSYTTAYSRKVIKEYEKWIEQLQKP